jgi:hypothetical protein
MWRFERHIIAVRDSNFKFIWDSRDPDRPALYDLVQDPGESSNIGMERPALVAHYQAIVDEHRDRQARNGNHGQEPILETDQEIVRRLRDLGYLD